MSNGVFNFNFLALTFSEILEGSQIYTRGLYAPWTPPSGEIFVPKASISQYLIVLFISTIQLQYFPGYWGGSQINIRGPCTPQRRPSGKILTCAQVLACIYIIVNFQLRSFIHAGLQQLCIKKSAKMGFWGDFGERGLSPNFRDPLYVVGTPLGMQ